MLRVYVRILCESVCIRVCVCIFNRRCMASVMQNCVKCEKKQTRNDIVEVCIICI